MLETSRAPLSGGKRIEAKLGPPVPRPMIDPLDAEQRESVTGQGCVRPPWTAEVLRIDPQAGLLARSFLRLESRMRPRNAFPEPKGSSGTLLRQLAAYSGGTAPASDRLPC